MLSLAVSLRLASEAMVAVWVWHHSSRRLDVRTGAMLIVPSTQVTNDPKKQARSATARTAKTIQTLLITVLLC